MITVDYNRGRGVQKNSKNDYVILEQPLTCNIVLCATLHLFICPVLFVYSDIFTGAIDSFSRTFLTELTDFWMSQGSAAKVQERHSD